MFLIFSLAPSRYSCACFVSFTKHKLKIWCVLRGQRPSRASAFLVCTIFSTSSFPHPGCTFCSTIFSLVFSRNRVWIKTTFKAFHLVIKILLFLYLPKLSSTNLRTLTHFFEWILQNIEHKQIHKCIYVFLFKNW